MLISVKLTDKQFKSDKKYYVARTLNNFYILILKVELYFRYFYTTGPRNTFGDSVDFSWSTLRCPSSGSHISTTYPGATAKSRPWCLGSILEISQGYVLFSIKSLRSIAYITCLHVTTMRIMYFSFIGETTSVFFFNNPHCTRYKEINEAKNHLYNCKHLQNINNICEEFDFLHNFTSCNQPLLYSLILMS